MLDWSCLRLASGPQCCPGQRSCDRIQRLYLAVAIASCLLAGQLSAMVAGLCRAVVNNIQSQRAAAYSCSLPAVWT